MAEGTCASCKAHKKLVGRGLCSACHQRLARRGELSNFPVSKRTFSQSLALARRNETEEGCWPWPSASRTGYATAISYGGRAVNAHVASFLHSGGSIDDGMTLDHTCHSDSTTCPGGTACRHRRCVRPDHLEPVTPKEQQARRPDRRLGICANGHEWSVETIRWSRDSRGATYRACRVCDREKAAVRRASNALGVYQAGKIGPAAYGVPSTTNSHSEAS